MKLLTLNCHSWQEENQVEKIKYLAKVIVENNYDVIALQEVSQRINVKGQIAKDNYIYILMEELQSLSINKYEFLWDLSHIGYDIYEEGLALLTKHKIIDYKSFYVSNSKDIRDYKSRKVIMATIIIKNIKYQFLSCHLGWWKDKDEPFINQADKLFDNIDMDIKTFIMGDFNNNAFIKGEGYDYLLKKGLYDTYNLAKKKDSAITVKGEIDGWGNDSVDKRLDLILMNKKVEIKSSKVVFNGENRQIISDHYGVEIIL